jgi:hypothetical protein
MPFGLTNAPSVFQALMNDVFREFLDDFVMVYLNDIIIYSKSDEEHLQEAETVQKLKNHDLFGKISKCNFNETEVDFLSHVVNAKGIKMQTVRWRPFRSGIANFSTLAAPLTNATRGQRKTFYWGKLQESAFHDVKSAYTTAPLLEITDPALYYVVTTDSSDVGIGAVLEQEYND